MGGKRLYFLDNLKAFIVNLMIVFHIALCYMNFAPEWWYVVDEEHTELFFTCVVVWADMFIMPVMFFVSGYFGIMSLKRHGDGKWWKGRGFRIAVPWVLGSALLAPPVTYLMLSSRNVPIDYWTYYNTLFIHNPETGGPGVMYSQTQYWYLGILLLFYILLWIWTKLKPDFLEQKLPRKPSIWFFAFIGIFCWANSVVFPSVFQNDDLWMFLSYVFVIQPCRILIYVVYFFAGCYAWRHQWFVEGGYTPDALKWGVGLIVFTVLYPGWILFGNFLAPDPAHFLVYKAFLHTGLTMTAMFGLLGIFKAVLNYTNKFLGEAAANSYTMYFIHMSIIYLPVWYMCPMEINTYVKYIIACVVGIIGCYIASKLLLFLPFFAGSKKAKASR